MYQVELGIMYRSIFIENFKFWPPQPVNYPGVRETARDMRSNQPKKQKCKTNCKADTLDVSRHQTWREPLKQDRSNGQLFRPSWDSSVLCREDMQCQPRSQRTLPVHYIEFRTFEPTCTRVTATLVEPNAHGQWQRMFRRRGDTRVQGGSGGVMLRFLFINTCLLHGSH